MKPKPRSENTLVCLIQSMTGRKVVVELRNDVLLRGNLEDVDEFLKWVIITPPRLCHARQHMLYALKHRIHTQFRMARAEAAGIA